MPWEEFAFGMTATVFITGIALTAIYLVTRWTRKGKAGPGEDVREALERLEQRSEQLTAGIERLAELDHRVLDLEERVDFAERMLTQDRARDRLAGGGA